MQKDAAGLKNKEKNALSREERKMKSEFDQMKSGGGVASKLQSLMRKVRRDGSKGVWGKKFAGLESNIRADTRSADKKKRDAAAKLAAKLKKDKASQRENQRFRDISKKETSMDDKMKRAARAEKKTVANTLRRAEGRAGLRKRTTRLDKLIKKDGKITAAAGSAEKSEVKNGNRRAQRTLGADAKTQQRNDARAKSGVRTATSAAAKKVSSDMRANSKKARSTGRKVDAKTGSYLSRAKATINRNARRSAKKLRGIENKKAPKKAKAGKKAAAPKKGGRKARRAARRAARKAARKARKARRAARKAARKNGKKLSSLKKSDKKGMAGLKATLAKLRAKIAKASKRAKKAAKTAKTAKKDAKKAEKKAKKSGRKSRKARKSGKKSRRL